MPSPPWRPKKSTRILLGVLAAWPPVYAVLFLASLGFMFLYASHAPKHSDPTLFFYIFPLHCLTMMLGFAVTAAYVVHAVRNDRLQQEQRIIWLILLLMAGIIAAPVYWWFHLRPGAEETLSS